MVENEKGVDWGPRTRGEARKGGVIQHPHSSEEGRSGLAIPDPPYKNKSRPGRLRSSSSIERESHQHKYVGESW